MLETWCCSATTTFDHLSYFCERKELGSIGAVLNVANEQRLKQSNRGK